jgi:hypothetical protein
MEEGVSMHGARQVVVRYSIVEVSKAKSRSISPHTRDGGERPSRTQYNQLLTVDMLGLNGRAAYRLVCNFRFCPMARFEMVFVSLLEDLNSKSEK